MADNSNAPVMQNQDVIQAARGIRSNPLATIGRIALTQGQLDNALRMTVKDLAGVTEDEALDVTARQGPRDLRERVRKLGRMRLGEGPALVRLDALLQRASRVTERRNQLLHSVWSSDIDGRGDYLRKQTLRVPPVDASIETDSATTGAAPVRTGRGAKAVMSGCIWTPPDCWEGRVHTIEAR